MTTNKNFYKGIEGILLILSLYPAFILLNKNVFDLYTISSTIASSILYLLASFLLTRRVLVGKIIGFAAILSNMTLIVDEIRTSPFIALSSGIVVIFSFYFLLYQNKIKAKKNDPECLYKAIFASLTSLILAILAIFFATHNNYYFRGLIILSIITELILFARLSCKEHLNKINILLAAEALISIILFSFFFHFVFILAIILNLFNILFFLNIKKKVIPKIFWFEELFFHPARILFFSFLFLVIIGTFLLLIPFSTEGNFIEIIDAAFTSVSAVCVTGLIVLDTPHDFTISGQFFILLLIQLGGLGIMTITTVAMQILGKRISLKHERILTNLTDTEHETILNSLVTIIKFTLIAELIGAIILTASFYHSTGIFWQSCWNGIFTSISAFCNAGFSLQSDSLMSYNTNPFIINTVALLIVTGGLAPATCYALPSFIRKKKIPIIARLSILTTAIMLIVGTVLFLFLEWDNTLVNMSIFDKIQNSWFQSVTLRTAGFNSVQIADILSPTYILMICFMFIGGSPGGTAGGIKTTTIAILAITFWANITNKEHIIFNNRKIRAITVARAITIFFASFIIMLAFTFMVDITQILPAEKIFFEVVSALGTVGLSMDLTPSLDIIGKILIMITMFIGRIGPITIFMLLSKTKQQTISRCPEEKITLF